MIILRPSRRHNQHRHGHVHPCCRLNARSRSSKVALDTGPLSNSWAPSHSWTPSPKTPSSSILSSSTSFSDPHRSTPLLSRVPVKSSAQPSPRETLSPQPLAPQPSPLSPPHLLIPPAEPLLRQPFRPLDRTSGVSPSSSNPFSSPLSTPSPQPLSWTSGTDCGGPAEPGYREAVRRQGGL